jgi:hypothetical protein
VDDELATAEDRRKGRWINWGILTLCVVIVSFATAGFLYFASKGMKTANSQLDRALCWQRIAGATRKATQSLQLEVVSVWFEGGYSICSSAILYPTATTFDLWGLSPGDLGSDVYNAAHAVLASCRAMGLNATLNIESRRLMYAQTRDFAWNYLRPTTDSAVSNLESVLSDCADAIEADDTIHTVVQTGFTNNLAAMRRVMAATGYINGHISNPMLIGASKDILLLLLFQKAGQALILLPSSLFCRHCRVW